ncbi:Uncharacterised protein [Mycobacteroides abscessus subsp. massiliense]|nr:Uncharacterised protein [Mycobacteroides abscessus subsp. massiliense]
MHCERGGDIAIDDGLDELLKPVMGHVMVGESQRDGVGTGEGGAGQCGVQSQLSRGTGKQIGSAHIRDESDAHLGHADLGGVGDDAGVGMSGHSDTAAHHDAIHQRHIRFREPADLRVELVLLAEETAGHHAVDLGAVVDLHHVAPGAQAAFPGAGEHHGADVVVGLPLGQGHRHRGDHVVCQ